MILYTKARSLRSRTGGHLMTEAPRVDIPELLRMIPIFRRLTSEALEIIAPLVIPRHFAKGQIISLEGSPSDHFYWVTSGRVKVYKSTPSGKEVILEIFANGDPFGAVAVFESTPYPASVAALEDTKCITLPSEPFFSLMERHPALVRGLLSGLTHRLIELTNRLAALTVGRIEARLARLLLKAAHDYGQAEGESILVPLHLPRQELADMVGTTIETCIRIMSRWEKENTVHTIRDGFVILRRKHVEEIAKL